MINDTVEHGTVRKAPVSIICSMFLHIFVHIYIENDVSQDATELLLTLLSAHVYL